MGKEFFSITPYVGKLLAREEKVRASELILGEALKQNAFQAKRQEGFKAQYDLVQDGYGSNVRLRVELPFGSDGVASLGYEDIIAFRDFLVSTTKSRRSQKKAA
jgi:hypothetical protein